MPVARCPSCELILTQREAASAACPDCAAPLPHLAPPPEPPPPEPPPSPRSRRRLALALPALCAVAALVFLLWPSDRPSEDEGDRQADTQNQPHTPKDHAKVNPKRPVLTPERLPEPLREALPDPPINVAKAPDPLPKPKTPAPPPRFVFPFVADDAVKVDGDLADWKGVPVALLTAVKRGALTKKVVASPPTVKSYFAYTRKGILVAVDAVDTSGALENDIPPSRGKWSFWNNDALEVFIDTLNQGNRKRGEPNAHQFVALPFGTPDDKGTGGYESKILFGKNGRTQEWSIVPYPASGERGLRRAAKKTATGWALEVFIPRAILREGELKPGVSVGFELQLDTGTNVFYHWACTRPKDRASTRPDLWAEVVLGGTDGRVELLGADGKPTSKFTEGNPITVRVTDADVNLDPAVREKAAVTLWGAGKSKALSLEETGPDTGIFVGTLKEGFAAGSGKENLTVEYVDWVRANGQRDVPLRVTFAVGR